MLFAFEAGTPVSLWRLSEDARRGVRSVGAALVLVSASAILEAVERELEKADELLRPAAARRADVPGALALRGARAAFALCSACVSAFSRMVEEAGDSALAEERRLSPDAEDLERFPAAAL